MLAIVNGTLVLPDGVIEGQTMLCSSLIEGFVPLGQVPADATVLDAQDGYVLPGLIDLHVHGYAGVDVTAANDEELIKMEAALLKEGVTGFLATTVTASYATLEKAWAACRRRMAGQNTTLLGVNAEGPFISPAKCGAQDPAFAVPPDPAWMLPYADVIKLTTIAPEWPGAADAVAELTAAGLSVAVGHTAADYDTVERCIQAGATHATHLFNGMSGLHHRSPGAAGAVLSHPLTCELIADNHHVHPALYEPVWRCKGRQLCLITDCLAAGGLPPGTYPLGDAPVHSDGVLCRRPNGTLAGSAATLLSGIRHMHEATSIPLWECVNCATLNPAAVLGIDRRKGSLEPGKAADAVILDRNFSVRATVLGGEIVYSA